MTGDNYLIIKEKEIIVGSTAEEVYQLEDKIRDFIADYFRGDLDILILGVHEMLINAVEHGNQLQSEKEIQITVQITEQYIKIDIQDQGQGFNWREVAEKGQQELLAGNDFLLERGRGIALTCSCCERLWYNEKGNQTHLLFRREG